MKLSKSIEFDYGHKLTDKSSKCYNAHGHRGRLEVTVEGDWKNNTGMVVDFSVLKEKLDIIKDSLDHTFMVSQTDVDFICYFIGAWCPGKLTKGFGDYVSVVGFGNVHITPVPPTAEYIAATSYSLLQAFASLVTIVSVRFWETPNSMAEYTE